MNAEEFRKLEAENDALKRELNMIKVADERAKAAHRKSMDAWHQDFLAYQERTARARQQDRDEGF